MAESIVNSIVDFLNNTIPPQLVVFLISICPVLELRGGMIAARILELDFFQAFIISYIGNMLPIPFILLFIRKIFQRLRNKKFWGQNHNKAGNSFHEKK